MKGFIFGLIVGVACTYYYTTIYNQQVKVVYKDKVVEKIVYRKYAKMTVKEKDQELFKYDTDPFKLDIEKINRENFNYRITGELHRRKAHRDIRIEAGSSGNWKFYVGGAVAIGVGYGIYRLVK